MGKTDVILSIEASQYQLVHILQLWYDLTMIQLKTMMNCIDNSGAAVVECVKVMRMKRHAKIGDRVIVVVQKQRNFSESGPGASVSTSAANKVRRGDIRHAVVVRTAKKLQRPDGSVVKFDDNACVLIKGRGADRDQIEWCCGCGTEEDEMVKDPFFGPNA